MNSRVSKIISRHIAEAVRDKRIDKKNTRRARRALKRDYNKLTAAERDDFALMFTPQSVRRARTARWWKNHISEATVHVDMAYKEAR